MQNLSVNTCKIDVSKLSISALEVVDYDDSLTRW